MAFGYLGQFIFALIGGFLYDYVSPYAPFAFIGCVDLSYALIALYLGHKGILIDDIGERKLKEYKASQALKLKTDTK